MNSKEIKRAKKIASFAIGAGFFLYASKYARDFFNGNETVSFILGFLPNLGMAFGLPFIYVVNRIRFKEPIKHFLVACIVSLLLLVLNEIRDIYDAKRVFDWLDIYASLAGVVLAYLVFHFTIRNIDKNLLQEYEPGALE